MGRILGFVGVLISAGLVFYLYTKQAQSVASIGGGTTIQAAENMTGVRAICLASPTPSAFSTPLKDTTVPWTTW